MTNTRVTLQNKVAQIRNLEAQIRQIANNNIAQRRGMLLSTIEVNPNDQCNAITFRSGNMVMRGLYQMVLR